MLELVFASLKVRPFRTLISVIGVAIGVVLVVLFTGLARGMANDTTRRASNWKAEIIFTRPGGMDMLSSNAALNVAYAGKLLEIEGVQSTLPVYRYLTSDNRGKFGIRQLDGVDFNAYAEMNGMHLVEGRAPTASDEIVMDQREIKDDKLKVGDTYELFGDKHYRIVGVFEPPSGSRIKMSLEALQEAMQNNKCTYILVKLKEGADVDTVAARINEALPGNKLQLTRDLVIDAQERIPSLNTFLRVLVILGAFVSTVFVLLSMYTTITERRKEIGILKSLGASNTFIISTIEGEALLIGVLGVVVGFILAFSLSYLIDTQFGLPFEFARNWMIWSVIIAIGGSLLGALYPAWRASGIDPVEVMVNE